MSIFTGQTPPLPRLNRYYARMKLLLWDIDGTLLQTSHHGRDLMHTVGRGLFGAGFSLDGVELGGQVDLALFHRAMKAGGYDPTPDHWRAFRQAFAKALRETLHETRDALRIMPGVVDLLETLHGRPDVLNGIVTGNFREAAQAKLEAAEIDHDRFHPTAFGCDSHDRRELVRLAIERGGNGFRGRDVIVIGDTPRDVACAKAHGALAFAVATGPYDTITLREAGADIVVDDLNDETSLLALIG